MKDVVFFRFGYYNYTKLNTENMVKKFKADQWYVVDLLIDWEKQRVSIYIDGAAHVAVPFFTTMKEKIESVNAV